jgi:Zn-dependent M28 family amino/carboxypeptidase
MTLRFRFLPALVLLPVSLHAQPFNGARTIGYAQQIVNCGPRFNNSPGLSCAQNFLKKQFAKDNLEVDTFTATTPAGPQTMHNLIVRFPGKKEGIIVLASHYETNYPLRNTSFIGANDGAATSALLIEIANNLRPKLVNGKLDGYSVWLVFFDGEEAVQSWSSSDSLYGSRHLAAKWQNDGTNKKIKAFLLADMIGDKSLDITRDQSSTPALLDTVYAAAKKLGDEQYFFKTSTPMEDDHIPFMMRGVPCADIIDYDYGPHDQAHPDGWHHTPEDTMDKISAKSLAISGSVFLETIRLIDQR